MTQFLKRDERIARNEVCRHLGYTPPLTDAQKAEVNEIVNDRNPLWVLRELQRDAGGTGRGEA